MASRSLRILVISNLCPPDYDGGFELSALRNAMSLRDRGHQVDLVTSKFRSNFDGDRTDHPFVHRIFNLSMVRDGWSMAATMITGDHRQGVTRRGVFHELRLRKANLNSILSMMKESGGNEDRLRTFLKDRDYDVAYVFGLHLIGTSLIHALTEKGIPVLYHHGDEWLASYLGSKGMKAKVLRFLRTARYDRERSVDLKNVYLVSGFMARKFEELGFKKEQLGVIHRGFEHPMVMLPEEDRYSPKVFLVASRLAMYKGIQIALRAAKKLKDRRPDLEWEMWIAGTGDEEAVRWYESFVEENGLSDRVKFLGKLSRERVVETMRRCTAFISPSVFDEPFGNTNIEAMASGATLIASRSGAIEEIIVHSESGLIYDRREPSELCGHMEMVLDHPEIARKLAETAFERVKTHFTQAVIMDKVEAKLAEVAGVEVAPVQDGAVTLR